MWTLKGRKALVTGGSKGIGKAVVEEFLDLGAEVVFTARQGDAVLQLEEALGAEGFQVKGIVSDVTDPLQQGELTDMLSRLYGQLDILVNNAGINIRKPSEQYSGEEYRKILESNLIAPFELSRKLLPLLRKGRMPSIVNVASVAARFDVRTGAPYGMSKAGLLQQTRNLAVEWAPYGIRVNAVSPWFTKTPLTAGLLASEDRMQHILARTPLGRVAEPGEIAGVIAFLAMDKASYISGQNIVIDGGMSASAF